MIKMESIWMKLDSGVGFSKGWAALALKKPPPLMPSILMATWEAMGPAGIVWVSTLTSAITGLPWASLTSWPPASFFGTWVV
jgi:hypothetical protein